MSFVIFYIISHGFVATYIEGVTQTLIISALSLTSILKVMPGSSNLSLLEILSESTVFSRWTTEKLVSSTLFVLKLVKLRELTPFKGEKNFLKNGKEKEKST